MDKKVKIYGASDDLIEIEGAINDEASDYDATNLPIRASDGTFAKITYNGEWKINVITEGDKFLGKIHSVGNDGAKHRFPDSEGCTPYSDVLVLDEGIEWVKIGRKKYK